MKTKFTVLIGNYGSGKTELALNLAINSAKAGKSTALVDLDIVNPYFRSAEQRELLEQNGVELIASDYACTGIDLPIVSAKVNKTFVGGFDEVVFDVGGDNVGATALGRYFYEFENVRENVNAYYVVNTRRPLAHTPDDICQMLNTIQNASRMKLTGFINNTNLAAQSNADLLIEGDEIMREVTGRTGLEVKYVSGVKSTLQQLAAKNAPCKGELLEIVTYMRPSWLDLP